jgi:hypothetical protein
MSESSEYQQGYIRALQDAIFENDVSSVYREDDELVYVSRRMVKDLLQRMIDDLSSG